MNQTQRDRAWKILEKVLLVGVLLFLVVNARDVIHWLIGFSVNAALTFAVMVTLGILAASLENLFRYRKWVRKEYRYQKLRLGVHWRLYRHWRRLGAPDPDEDQRPGDYPKLSK